MNANQQLHIRHLADCQEAIPQLARWLFEEWGRFFPGASIERGILRLQERIHRDRVPLSLVAVDGKSAVGTISLIACDMETRSDLSPWLASLYVVPEQRRRGIGSALVESAVCEARRLGIDTLYLFTDTSEALYAALGWQRMLPCIYQGREVVIMSKPMDTEASMVSYYAERAKEYERIYHKPERQDDLVLLRDFVEQAFVGAHVLEVACGTGYWTEVLARSAASVTATDINEEVLAVARAKSLEPRKVTLRREDAYSLPRLPQRFTGGFSGFWWSHIPKARIQDFLRGFHRALSPGAKVVFIDNNYVEGSSTPISRTDKHGDTYQIRRLDDGSTHEVLKNFPTRSELHSIANGLATDVRVESLRYYWILSYMVV